MPPAARGSAEAAVNDTYATSEVEVDDGDVEPLLADPANDPGEQDGVELAEVGVAGVDQADVGGNALADGAEVTDFVGDLQNALAGVGADLGVVVEGAGDGGDGEAGLLGYLAN